MIIGKASWTGDGTSPRIISDVNGNTGTPVAVFVHGVNQQEMIWISGMNVSVPLGRVVATIYSQGIMSASTGCFAVGSDNVVNKSATAYWAEMIFNDTDNRVNFGSYAGTGATKNISTTNAIAWDYVITVPTGSASDLCIWKTTQMASTNSIDFSATGQIVTNEITGLGTGTFAVSSLNTVNRSGETFFYLTMASTANVFVPFQYTGSGATQNVGAVGFTPDIAFIKGNAAVVGWNRHAAETQPGMSMSGGSELAAGVFGFFNGGFSVGTQTSVNQNTTIYYAAALTDTTPPSTPILGSPRFNRLLMGM